MKVNKKYLGIRIIVSPIKLLFLFMWYLLFSILLTFRWIKYGSGEVFFGKEFGDKNIGDLISKIEKLLENHSNHLNSRENGKKS